MSAVQAAEHAHLKPGILVGHLARVALVEGVLWFKYPHANMRAISQRLEEVAAEIDPALIQLEREAFNNITASR